MQTFHSVKHKISKQIFFSELTPVQHLPNYIFRFYNVDLWFSILNFKTVFKYCLKLFVLSSHKLKQRWKLLLQRTAKHSLFKNKRSFSFNNTSIPPIYSHKTKIPSPILSVFVCQTRELARMSAVIEPRPVHCVGDVPQLCALQLWDRQTHVRLIVLPMNCKLIVHFWYTIILHTLMEWNWPKSLNWVTNTIHVVYCLLTLAYS